MKLAIAPSELVRDSVQILSPQALIKFAQSLTILNWTQRTFSNASPIQHMLRRAGHIVSISLQAALLAFLTVASTARADEKPVADQVVEILGSEKGTVRKWTRAPRVLVIHGARSGVLEVNGLLVEIEKQVPDFPGFSSLEYFDLESLGRSPAGIVSMKPINETYEGERRVAAQVEFENGGTRTSLVSDIFIFYTDVGTGVLFGVISSTSTISQSLRGFAQGRVPCYFNVLSMDDSIQIAGVFIRNDLTKREVEECLYEELTQSLGLLNDSEGSSVFTYDDGWTSDDRSSADFMLLRSLYSGSVSPGDSPSRVAEVYGRYSKQPVSP